MYEITLESVYVNQINKISKYKDSNWDKLKPVTDM